MSGHSKWNNIKRKKEKTDGARAKVFTKIGREISVAVRNGGPNPASNSKLADLISKAKRMSVPNDNIQRIIKKAEGGDKTEYEAIKDPDEAMMDALDAGAEDFDAGEDAAEITTDPDSFSAVCNALEAKGYEFISADLAMVPMTTTRLTDPDQLKQMGKLLESLEDDDDVQNVWHSLENEEDLPE